MGKKIKDRTNFNSYIGKIRKIKMFFEIVKINIINFVF